MGQVLVLMGLPGSGKSTVARELMKRFPTFVRLDTDETRRFIFDSFYDDQGNPDPVIYDEKMKSINYQVILLITRYLLECGRDVLIEGVFNSNNLREKIFRLVHELDGRITFVDLQVTDEVARERLLKRIQLSPMERVSDADFSVYLKLRERREDPSSLIRECCHHVDATKGLFEIIEEISMLLSS